MTEIERKTGAEPWFGFSGWDNAHLTGCPCDECVDWRNDRRTPSAALEREIVGRLAALDARDYGAR